MDANENTKTTKASATCCQQDRKKGCLSLLRCGGVVVVGVGVVVGVVGVVVVVVVAVVGVVGRGVRLFRDSDRLFRLTDSRSLLFNTKVVPGAFVPLPEQNSRLSKKI